MIVMSYRALHSYAVCIAFAALSSPAWAQAALHLETDAGWSHGAVSNAALDARLVAAALEYRRYAPVPADCLLRSGLSEGLDRGRGDAWLRSVGGDGGRAGQHRASAAARLRPVRQWGSRAAARRPCGFVAACVRYHRASHVREVSSLHVLPTSSRAPGFTRLFARGFC